MKNLFVFLVTLITLLVSPDLQSMYVSETSVILIGDTGKNNAGQLAVSRAIEQHCRQEDCHLGILAGDVVYPSGLKNPFDDKLEIVFDRYYNQIQIPFLIALGNHDYGRYGNQWHRGQYQLLHAWKNPNFKLPHYWYVHETPETVFAVIDTQRLMWRYDIKVQAKLVRDAYLRAKAKNKWFMVVGHHPLLSDGTHGNAGRYERLSFPPFVSGKNFRTFMHKHVCGRAHFYLAGHDHSLQVMDGEQVRCKTRLIVSGTAAESTRLYRRNDSRFRSLQLGFFNLTIRPDQVKVRAFNEGNQLLYEENFSRMRSELALHN